MLGFVPGSQQPLKMKCWEIVIVIFMLPNLIENLSPEVRKEIVRVHNLLRKSVVPQAADMVELEYDESKEEEAQSYADKCIFEHSYVAPGENLQISGNNNFTKAIMDWFQERVYFNIHAAWNKKCLRENAPQGMDIMGDGYRCGHYTAMTVSTLSKVWCGSSYCDVITEHNGNTYRNKYNNVCQYDKGNTNSPYTVGPPCTGCPFDFPQCNDGLCTSNCKGRNCSCHVTCKRCGRKVENRCWCLCGMYGDSSTSDCSGSGRFVRDTISCGVCNAAGRSCLNGGEDVSVQTLGSPCVCKCPTGYKGDRCEYTPQHLKDMDRGVKLLIHAEKRENGIYFPADYDKFMQNWDRHVNIRQKIIEALEYHCETNTACKKPKYKSIFKGKNIHLAFGSPTQLADGKLEVIIFMQDKQCAIPFKYNEVVYHTCTFKDSKRSWCSTLPEYSSQIQSYIYCDETTDVYLHSKMLRDAITVFKGPINGRTVSDLGLHIENVEQMNAAVPD